MVYGSFIFRQIKNTCGILWSVRVFFTFLEVRRFNKYCLWEANLVFYMQLFSLMWQNVDLLWKNSSLKCWFYFRLFLWQTKNNFVYNFIAPLKCLQDTCAAFLLFLKVVKSCDHVTVLASLYMRNESLLNENKIFEWIYYFWMKLKFSNKNEIFEWTE